MRRRSWARTAERLPAARVAGPHRCNCLVWAIARWCRHGGYVAVRRSDYLPICHFLWSRNRRTWWGYAPLTPVTGWWRLPVAVWFRGAVTEETDRQGERG